MCEPGVEYSEMTIKKMQGTTLYKLLDTNTFVPVKCFIERESQDTEYYLILSRLGGKFRCVVTIRQIDEVFISDVDRYCVLQLFKGGKRHFTDDEVLKISEYLGISIQTLKKV